MTLAAAIGVPEPVKGEEIVCFCMPGARAGSPDEDAACRVDGADCRSSWASRSSPREIKFVAALPRTRNAKIMHRIIRAAYLGQRSGGRLVAWKTPRAVDAIRNASET